MVGARGPADFSALLRQKRDMVCEVPFGRWDLDEHYDPTPGTLGKTYVKCGGFIEKVDALDLKAIEGGQIQGDPTGSATDPELEKELNQL